jgi:hypothetical protein
MSGRYGVNARREPSSAQRRRSSSRTAAVTFRRVSLLGVSTLVTFGGLSVVETMPGPDHVAATLDAERRPSEVDRSDSRAMAKAIHTAVRSDAGEPPASPPPVVVEHDPDAKPAATAALPPGSGSGHRIVFDITAQQVWLVDDTEAVVRTYLVSGSRYDQLPTGTFEVFSKSEQAISWHGTETMEYMVRFYRGERSNIGFHDLPVDTATGAEVQTLAELGTPLSDGCIRQDIADAKALWDFAPVGTKVVVVRS